MAGSTEKGHLEKFWVYEGDNKSSRAEAMPGDSYTEEGVSYPGSFSFEHRDEHACCSSSGSPEQRHANHERDANAIGGPAFAG